MTPIYSSNRTPLSQIPPQKCLIHSKTDLQRLALRRSHPVSIEFRLEDADRTNTTSLRKLMSTLSRKTLKLKNPPVKEILPVGSLTRNLRRLQIKPEDAATSITQITRKFSRVRQFAIVDEHESFVPMRIKKKVHPMRALNNFVYDHEFSRDFLRCARYANDVKIRKTAMNFEELERFQRLEKIHLILKTKYLSLPEEDKKFTDRLGKILLRLPRVNSVVLEQEVDYDNSPFTFMELGNILKDKAKVSLVADFIDVSNHKHKNLTVEKMLQKIYDLGIENLKVNYAGVIKIMKRFERAFEAPIHTREDVYARFLKAIMDSSFKKVHFLPTAHSSHVDSQLQDIFIELLRSDNSVKIPGVNITYNLDMVEADNLDPLLDLYDQRTSFYDITIISSYDLRKGLTEKIKEHYSTVFSKINQANSTLSLRVVAKNLQVLTTILQMIIPKIDASLLKTLNVQVIDPLHNQDLENLFETLRGSGIFEIARKIEIDFAQKEFLNAESLFNFLSSIAQISSKVNKLKLLYNNSRGCEQGLKNAFERARRQYHKVDFAYEANNERTIYE